MTYDLLSAGPAGAATADPPIPAPAGTPAGPLDPRRGLHVKFYRPADVVERMLVWNDDTAREALSSRYEQAVVVGICHHQAEGLSVEPLPEPAQVFAPSKAAPAVWLERAIIGVPVWAVIPALPPGREQDWAVLDRWVSRWMAGPNYAASHDSRLRRVIGFYGAVAVHDRQRTRPSDKTASRPSEPPPGGSPRARSRVSDHQPQRSMP